MAAPVIDDVRMPEDISRGAVTASWKPTLFVETPAGSEQRIKLWTNRRRIWTINIEDRTAALGNALRAFWEARDGGLRGFRFKDWSEYFVTDEPLAPTGTPTVQLIKTYTSGSQSRVQNIYKPIASPAVTLKKNAVNLVGISIDTTTGLVTLPVVITKAITAISQAASAVVTVGAAHGFVTNDLVYISGVVGMTQINGLVGTVTATGASTITVNINSSSFTAYTSGGTAVKYLATTDTLSWTGQWDWPARFDLQEFAMTQEDVDWRTFSSVRLKELVS